MVKNSMKKIVALFFLLIPSIVILAHAIIPHYYDDILLVQESGKADEHDESESCLLSQVYIKINKEEQLFHFVDFNLFSSLFSCLSSLFLVNPVAKITELEGLPFRQKPYYLFYHLEFISHSLGLRAPPVR
jgi:hypothetical protein